MIAAVYLWKGLTQMAFRRRVSSSIIRAVITLLVVSFLVALWFSLMTATEPIRALP